MFNSVDTKNPSAVEAEAAAIHAGLFPRGDVALVRQAFEWAGQCFGGGFDGYQAIDSLYHDFEHTLQGTLCLVRLLRSRHEAGVAPQISQRMFELALVAILFHDTGYLKTTADTEGTGAKYTAIHVARSGTFAEKFLTTKGWARPDIAAVRHMIRCTGVNVSIATIPFQSAEERVAGFALATADLLGQMAAENYVERLPDLYLEFEEAARFDEGSAPKTFRFESADDMMRKTPGFWQYYVLPKITNDFEGIYTCLNDPYPGGPNEYIRRIERNLARLRHKLEVRE
ncbi:MAG: hypothetical protein ABIP20_09670 [Chthoniobacteraceae bacterium]